MNSEQCELGEIGWIRFFFHVRTNFILFFFNESKKTCLHRNNYQTEENKLLINENQLR